MLEAEYVKSMQCNYERIHLEEKPEEQRYQYCILSRGGIAGLLPSSLRYLDDQAYIYYDITSLQSLSHEFRRKTISRDWVKEFGGSLKRIQQELHRFLLDEGNVLWYPEHVFQDLDNGKISFLYYPYLEEDNGFMQLLEFLVERMDYEDDGLVECVYRMYEQFEQNGATYLQERIFTDLQMLEKPMKKEGVISSGAVSEETDTNEDLEPHILEYTRTALSEREKEKSLPLEDHAPQDMQQEEKMGEEQPKEGRREKRGWLSFLENSKKKEKDRNDREIYYRQTESMFEGSMAAVAEEREDYTPEPKEEYGHTVYMEQVVEPTETCHRLFSQDGQMLAKLTKDLFVIGKKAGEVDLVLANDSVSRVHAQIFCDEEGNYFFEDRNSTNGCWKNGIRLAPFERKRLDVEDELRLGSVTVIFR